jgi:hypothetical protein
MISFESDMERAFLAERERKADMAIPLCSSTLHSKLVVTRAKDGRMHLNGGMYPSITSAS